MQFGLRVSSLLWASDSVKKIRDWEPKQRAGSALSLWKPDSTGSATTPFWVRSPARVTWVTSMAWETGGACAARIGLVGLGLGTLRSQNSRESGLRCWCVHSDSRTVVYVCYLEQIS